MGVGKVSPFGVLVHVVEEVFNSHLGGSESVYRYREL